MHLPAHPQEAQVWRRHGPVPRELPVRGGGDEVGTQAGQVPPEGGPEMSLRGEIGDTFPIHPGDQSGRTLVTVTVEVDVLVSASKECLDLLLTTAHDFSTRPAPPPF
jgi:hypothetical protein